MKPVQKIISVYSIFLGLSVIGLWIMILKSGQISEGKKEMVFHLFSEFLMACLCILSGIKLLLRHNSAILVNVLAHGMVIYSVLNAAGYYGEKGSMPMTIMFLILFILSSAVIFTQLYNINK